jgi:hypothetical protein
MDATPDGATLSLAEWMDRLRASLVHEVGVDTSLSAEEERHLLELARIAAHTSERIAAPLTTFVAGLSLAGLPSDARARRLRQLVAELRR